MADKMMRIAGRGTDGTAKPLKTNNNGSLLVNEPQVNQLQNSQTALAANGEQIFGPFNSEDYTKGRISLDVTTLRNIQVFIQYQQLNNATVYDSTARILVYDSEKTTGLSNVHVFEYDIFPQRYQIIIKNMGTATILSRVTEVRFKDGGGDNQIKFKMLTGELFPDPLEKHIITPLWHSASVNSQIKRTVNESLDLRSRKLARLVITATDEPVLLIVSDSSGRHIETHIVRGAVTEINLPCENIKIMRTSLVKRKEFRDDPVNDTSKIYAELRLI